MKLSSALSWADKLALMHKFELTDTEACTAFGIPKAELATAKNLETRGTFSANTSLNTEIYSDFFVRMRSGELDTTQKTFKPKGVRPSKITLAFDSITSVPQKVDDVVEKFGVSVAVLRQSKRFDKSGAGQIHIRKDKETQSLMVWREAT